MTGQGYFYPILVLNAKLSTDVLGVKLGVPADEMSVELWQDMDGKGWPVTPVKMATTKSSAYDRWLGFPCSYHRYPGCWR